MSGPREALRRLALRVAARALPAGSPPARPRRALLIRPDHLGDLLLTSPAVARLRREAPSARLSLLVGPWSEAVARRGAEVDEILTCPFPGFARRPKRGPLEPYAILLAEAARLRGRFDLALVLRPDHWWGALLAAAAGIPLRLGYDTPLTGPFLTEALPLPADRHVVELSLSLVERAAALLEPEARPTARPRPTPPDPIFRLTAAERAWAAGLAAEQGGPLVLLHPGSGSPLKNWPPGRWALVADALAARGARVVLTGGADDPAGPRAVAAAMRHRPLLLAGTLTLGRLGALAERSALALGADSGPLHLAAALGRPTLRLYGPTDPLLFGPWGPPAAHLALTAPLPCRPCGNLERPPCGAAHEPPCLLGIPTERVAAAAIELLGVGAGHPTSVRA